MVVCTFQEKSDKEKEEIEEEEKRFEGSGYDRDLIELLGKCRMKNGMLTHCGPVFFPLYLSQIINSR
jgi:hypothetical protein